MTELDVVPLVVVGLVGLVCGRFLSPGLAWLVALEVPAIHLVVGLVTRRAAEDLWDDIVSTSILLLCVAVLGVATGTWLRQRPRL